MNEPKEQPNDAGSVLPSLKHEDLPPRLARFLADHPIFVRLYVPAVVTTSLVIQLILPPGRCH